MFIAWHPSCCWDWCTSEDEKKEAEKLWKKQIVVLKLSDMKSPPQGIFLPHPVQGHKYMSFYESIPRWIIETPDHLKTQEMCNEAVDIGSYLLVYVPDHFKTQKMCDETMRNKPFSLGFVPDHFKTIDMCKEAVNIGPQSLAYVPSQYKTQVLCNEAVGIGPLSLGFVPDQCKT